LLYNILKCIYIRHCDFYLSLFLSPDINSSQYYTTESFQYI